jgi:hypothetical protein
MAARVVYVTVPRVARRGKAFVDLSIADILVAAMRPEAAGFDLVAELGASAARVAETVGAPRRPQRRLLGA